MTFSSDSLKFEGLIAFYPVHDLAASADFYGRDLGLSLARDQESCLVFRVVPGAYLGFCQSEGALPQRPGVILTLLVQDVDGLYGRLRSLGTETEAPPRENARFGIYHFFARDPDGYRVEIQRFLEPLEARTHQSC